MSIDKRVAERQVEGEFVIDLPDGPGQGGVRLRYVDDAVRIDFKDRPDLPFARAFDDGVKEKLSMLIWGEIRFHVEVNGSPIPALRDDSAPTKADTRASNVRQERPKLYRHTWPFLVLKDTGLNDVFQESGIGDARRTSTFR